MRMKVPAQRWTSLLLLIAFLHGVLAPAVSLAAGKHDFVRTVLVPLCGADGHQLIEIELPDHDTEPAAESEHGGLCLLCVYPATAAPVSLAAFPPVVSASAPVFMPGDSHPPLSAAWPPSLARAPPSDV